MAGEVVNNGGAVADGSTGRLVEPAGVADREGVGGEVGLAVSVAAEVDVARGEGVAVRRAVAVRLGRGVADGLTVVVVTVTVKVV